MLSASQETCCLSSFWTCCLLLDVRLHKSLVTSDLQLLKRLLHVSIFKFSRIVVTDWLIATSYIVPSAVKALHSVRIPGYTYCTALNCTPNDANRHFTNWIVLSFSY